MQQAVEVKHTLMYHTVNLSARSTYMYVHLCALYVNPSMQLVLQVAFLDWQVCEYQSQRSISAL